MHRGHAMRAADTLRAALEAALKEPTLSRPAQRVGVSHGAAGPRAR